MPDTDDKTLYLLDASGFIFRAYHALPGLTRADGTPVGAVSGFCNMLYKLLCDLKASHMAVIFDAKRENWRHDVYTEYKANRPEPPEDLIPQCALIREATKAFMFQPLEVEGYEADDLIASYVCAAKDAGYEVVIVSSDKDLMQLIRPGVTMWDPLKQKTLGPEAVMEKFGVTPDKVIDVQSLIGDSTDNVPGVPGVGPKTAAELIDTYGDLDTVLAKADEIKKPKLRENLINFAEQARISRRLVSLSCDAPLPAPIDDLTTPAWNGPELRAFLAENGFKTLLSRVGPGGSDCAPPAKAALKDPTPASVATTPVHTPVEPEAVVIDRSTYKTISNINELNEFLRVAESSGILAVDTETTHLTPAHADLVGISLSTPGAGSCYIPLGHKGAEDLLGGGRLDGQLSESEAFSVLKPILESPSVLKIGHNIKYDLQLFLRGGITVAPIDDTMLISYVLDGGKTRHGMDELAQKCLGHTMISYAEVAGKNGNFAHVDLNKATEYASEDADVTLCLWQTLKPRLLAERQVALYERIERPLPPVIAGMELEGIFVNTDTLRDLENEFSLKANGLEEEIYQLAEGRFLISSPKQLGEVLFERLGLPGGSKTKTGQWSTDAETIERLAEEHDLPVLNKILEWRQLTKLISTYTRALREAVNPRTGRVHTSYALAATSTGRLSSTDPNLQNIPIRTEEGRRIRTAFEAKPGHVLISADYSQIELRLMAEIADVKALKQAFASGEDIHAFTARQVFGVPDGEALSPDLRRAAKAINFGIIYGQSAFGLARGLNIGRAEAAEFINAYFARYPEIKTYMDATKAEAREKLYVTTLFGRRCWVEGIAERNPARRAAFERQAINAPLQGTAADLIKLAMMAVHNANLPAKLLLQVHDELILEVEESKAEAVAAQVKALMEGVADLSVPIVAEAGIGKTWASAH